MNMDQRIASGLMTLSLVTGFCGCRTRPICFHSVVPHNFSVSEVAGPWIGFNCNGTDLYRLELRGDGTGILTSAYSSTTNVETIRYEIPRWEIDTNNLLTCAFSNRGAEAGEEQLWPVKMTCKVSRSMLEALLRNGEGGWKASIVFWRQKDFEEKLRVLRE